MYIKMFVRKLILSPMRFRRDHPSHRLSREGNAILPQPNPAMESFPYDQPEWCKKLLDAAHITANKNTIPNDPQKAFVTSGIRLGTPAATSRGLNTEDFDKVAEAIATVIKKGEEGVIPARDIVKTLTDKYPLSGNF